jgi:hypothetical protein
LEKEIGSLEKVKKEIGERDWRKRREKEIGGGIVLLC